MVRGRPKAGWTSGFIRFSLHVLHSGTSPLHGTNNPMRGSCVPLNATLYMLAVMEAVDLWISFDESLQYIYA